MLPHLITSLSSPSPSPLPSSRSSSGVEHKFLHSITIFFIFVDIFVVFHLCMKIIAKRRRFLLLLAQQEYNVEVELHGSPPPPLKIRSSDPNKVLRHLSYRYYDEGDDEMCSICLEEFKKGEMIRIMPCDCKCMYHTDCIALWFYSNSESCPVCKETVPQEWWEMDLEAGHGGTDR